MKISINPLVLDLFPQLEIFGLVVSGLDQEKLKSQVISSFHKPNEQKAEIVANMWKEIYKVFPRDKKARASINYLTKASLNNTLKYIHPLVDIYNQASLLSLSPFGGEDMDFLKGLLEISVADGSEPFTPLGDRPMENPKAGEIVWVDSENRVVCRSLNWLESDIHKITQKTRDVVFVSEKPLENLPDPSIGINFIAEQLKNYSSSCVDFKLNKELMAIDI